MILFLMLAALLFAALLIVNWWHRRAEAAAARLRRALDPMLDAWAARPPSRAELEHYLGRRRAAIGPWIWLTNGLYVAAPAAAYVLHAPLLLVGAISAASAGSRLLLKRGRLRWAARIEAEARTPGG